MHDNTRFAWNKNFPNGDRYNGEAIGEGVKDGTGEYYWAANGALYKGQWRNDLMHGHGVLTVPGSVPGAAVDSPSATTSRGYVYDGEFLAGKRSGHGTCRFANGRVYEGTWADDQMHGQGTLQGAPGLDDFSTYTGPFEMGVRSGSAGVCHYANGDVYDGTWRGGKRHGMGELRLAVATASSARYPGLPNVADGITTTTTAVVPVVYKGPFVQDVPTTNQPAIPGGSVTAEVQYSDGSSYVGGVDSLRRDGEGTWQLANGDVYRGQFRADCREGRGTLTSQDGTTYEGTWVRDKLSGRVNFKRASPTPRTGDNGAMEPADPAASSSPPPPGGLPLLVAYQGPCVDGELSGAGARATFSDGSLYKGGVRQGLPDGDGVWEQCHLRGLPPDLFGDDAFFCRYEGQLARGVPEGEGKATLQLAATLAPETEALPAHTHGLRIAYRRAGAYAGHWTRGLPQGRGVWKWEGGEAYTGDVGDGVAHGHGTLKNAQESYEGHFSHGQAEGHGSYEHHLLHQRYDGDWLNGFFHGEGTFVKQDARNADGHIRYQGSWRHGKKHGQGQETVGTIHYTGSFADGNYEGHGTLSMNGSTAHGKYVVHFSSYEGEFHTGLPWGKGRMVLTDGSVITGQFADGVPDGACQAEFAQGLQFDGVYDQGVVAGDGQLRYPNGDQYVGAVEPATASGGAEQDNPLLDLVPQRHGKGLFTFAEGNQLSCAWVHNVLNGDGTYIVAATGEKMQRTYVDGVLSTAPTDGHGGNIFTPENMFPNTQSEEALKEKLATKKRKPFTFVRKGDARQAANAPREDATAPESNPGHSNRRLSGRTSLQNGSTDAKAARRATATAGTVAATRTPETPVAASSQSDPSKPTRKPAAAAAGGGGAGGPKANERGKHQPVHGTSPRPSLREAHATKPTAGRKRRSSPMESSPVPIGTTPAANDSREIMERFQQGIVQMDSLSGFGKESCGLTTTTFDSAPSCGDEVMRSVTHSSTRPHGPLTGQLKTLMDEAASIRDSKEDEIHFLTEELRQLNEKIWQLRFSLSSTPQNNKGPSHLRSDVMTARLAALTEERTGTVQKLSFLLRE